MCRPSYIEGRLRLAENRERQRGKGAAPTGNTPPDGVPTPEERVAAEKAAEANMARLLQEEDAAKVHVSPPLLPKFATLMDLGVCMQCCQYVLNSWTCIVRTAAMNMHLRINLR